jgi:hypothetical protein
LTFHNGQAEKREEKSSMKNFTQNIQTSEAKAVDFKELAN